MGDLKRIPNIGGELFRAAMKSAAQAGPRDFERPMDRSLAEDITDMVMNSEELVQDLIELSTGEIDYREFNRRIQDLYDHYEESLNEPEGLDGDDLNGSDSPCGDSGVA